MKMNIKRIKDNLDTAEISTSINERSAEVIIEEYDKHIKKLKILGVVKCKKSLFKSTYEKNAFIKNRKYNIVENPWPKYTKEAYNKKELDTVYIKDVEGRLFHFLKTT